MLVFNTCDRFCLKFSWERFSPSLYCHIYCYILILDHITCNVFTAQCLKADCTIIVMSSRACTAVLYTVHPRDIVTRTGWHRGHASDATDVEKWMIRAVNHHTDTWHLNQSVAITQCPGDQTDIGLNGPNLIIVIWPDRPWRDFGHTSIWFLTFSLKWCHNHPKW